MSTNNDSAPLAPPAFRLLLGLLAFSAGAFVANIYYCQPLLDTIAGTFRVSPAKATAVATATQLGYAAGLLLVVPLADSLDRRRLIVGSALLSAAVLAAVATSRSIDFLIAASFAVGMVSMTPQLAVTYATGLAAPEHRGRTVGIVMSGLIVGILVSRTISGTLGAAYGWRTVYLLAAGATTLLAVVLAVVLPSQAPARRVAYRELLGSLPSVIATEPILRRHALVGALGFSAFSAFWTTLPFHLAGMPAHYGSRTAGLFGLVGAAGALAAAVSGRLAEKMSPRLLNGTALLLVVGSFGLMNFSGTSLALLAFGVILMDAGVQGSHISNQTRIFGLSTEKRNRLNAIYMVTYFLGGAAGSALGSQAWEHFGWSGVCVLGGVLGALGLAVLFVPTAAKTSVPKNA